MLTAYNSVQASFVHNMKIHLTRKNNKKMPKPERNFVKGLFRCTFHRRNIIFWAGGGWQLKRIVLEVITVSVSLLFLVFIQASCAICINLPFVVSMLAARWQTGQLGIYHNSAPQGGTVCIRILTFMDFPRDNSYVYFFQNFLCNFADSSTSTHGLVLAERNCPGAAEILIIFSGSYNYILIFNICCG
jgi:hypothetical protein